MPLFFNTFAANAKIKAMCFYMLKDEDYDGLLNCNNVTEIAKFLIYNTNYKKCLNHIDESEVHRGQLEDLINKYAFLNYSKIYRNINL